MARSIDPRRIEVLDPEIVDALRRKTSAEKGAMIFEANRFMRERLKAHLGHEHPDWTSEEVGAEIARRMLHGAN